MKPSSTDPIPSAYGGDGWSPRRSSRRDEIGDFWGACGLSSEWNHLEAVLLHAPGTELEDVEDPNAVQFVSTPDLDLAGTQHARMVEAYQAAGVTVNFIEPDGKPSPNLMFAADLFVMTPEGAILGRPASNIRAGEEVHVAKKLAELSIPTLASVAGTGTFEGADVAWIGPNKVLIGTGLRTNAEGASQVRDAMNWLGVEALITQLPKGVMHLMGVLRFGDADLAIIRRDRLPEDAVDALAASGFEVCKIPDESEAVHGHALNFVTLGPRKILAPAGNPISQTFYQDLGIEIHWVDVSELIKAAGAIGCLTGILRRSDP